MHGPLLLLILVDDAGKVLLRRILLIASLVLGWPRLKHWLESLQLAFNLAVAYQGFGAHYHGSLKRSYSSQCTASAKDLTRRLLVCNGFKDAEYISLALTARKTVVVFEQEEELNLAFELSKKLNTRPTVGMQAKLRTRHDGHCGSTSGEKGIGIDYNGTKDSDPDVSVSYTLDEYVVTIVETLRAICDQKSAKHPAICSRSGRATVSHSDLRGVLFQLA
ncbi:hypothetical protein CRG98_044019 [Punica granatum]|uniref:Arginine decarboxylase n=1 Tax=Punica granatum TaxID=22663 RepID=A0A2I0HV40_PUNGR|nr:hypothetical protein CRG98_044019 [Punica granatum]